MRNLLILSMACILSCSCTPNDTSSTALDHPASLEKAQALITIQKEFIASAEEALNPLKQNKYQSMDISIHAGTCSGSLDGKSLFWQKLFVKVDSLTDEMVEDIEQVVYRSMQEFEVDRVDIDYQVRGPSHTLLSESEGVINDNYTEFRDSLVKEISLTYEEIEIDISTFSSSHSEADVGSFLSIIEDDNDVRHISALMTVIVDDLDDNIIKIIEQVVSTSMKAFDVEEVKIEYLVKSRSSTLTL